MKTLISIVLVFLTFYLIGCTVLTGEHEAEKFDTSQFPAISSNAPFTLDLEAEKVVKDGKKGMLLKLNITNPTSSPLALSSLGFTSGELLYQLVITRSDTSVVWKFYKANTLIAREEHFNLKPGETRTLSGFWDYTNTKGERIFPPSGTYLLFGGIWDVSQFDDTLQPTNRIAEFGNVGVGKNALKIHIE